MAILRFFEQRTRQWVSAAILIIQAGYRETQKRFLHHQGRNAQSGSSRIGQTSGLPQLFD
ncbi:hypothetical protein IQ268_00815 [Oculatella sp. LEGE 06141]|uniref:hypothetical protein n=1 Tax=Oculatella sp. LEGE 06141 TaxID=1828648 RepID=UPI00187E2B03|nr:hypothetical protein [Oculatella sp. LEGE 06141]MBE9177116.1 hypothetical protein [Oculatella sp. LEGE 06141]